MKHSSLLRKLVCCALGLLHGSLYAQGRTRTTAQLAAVVKPALSQCAPPIRQTKFGRVDPNSIIPTKHKKDVPIARVAKTLQGMWRGQVQGDPGDTKYDKHKDGNVDYF